MKNIVKVVALVLVLAVVAYLQDPIDEFLTSFSQIDEQDNDSGEDKPVICITQIAPHASLDQIRLGITEYLKEQGIAFTLIFENAQGNIANASQIGVKFASLNPKPDVIVPITTPSTLSLYKPAAKAGIPVIFSAVTDPVAVHLVPSYSKAGEGITGVYDLPPIAQQVDLIIEIFPYINKIGFLYNAGEPNSVKMLALFKEAASKKGIKVIAVAVSKSAEIPEATKKLVSDVPALYIPNDNTVISAISSVLLVAQSAHVPVFSSDPESVEKGCLAAFAYSQKEIGRKTGSLIADLLKGKPLKDIKPEKPDQAELFINLSVADRLRIPLPKTVLERSKVAFQEVKEDIHQPK